MNNPVKIYIEGLPRSGKTTVASMLYRYLSSFLNVYVISNDITEEAIVKEFRNEIVFDNENKRNLELIINNDSSHIDQFIDGSYSFCSSEQKYARFVLNYFRLPASLQNDFREYMKDFKLYATYNNVLYRVTGASRMGDIWLAKDFNREHGYNLCAMHDQITSWHKFPD